MKFKEPGGLSDFGSDAQNAWSALVEKYVSDIVEETGTTQFVTPDDPQIDPAIVTVDWRGFPLRINECLGSLDKTNRILDWEFRGQPMGRLNGAQEEYLEWRVVRNSDGRIVAMEFTSETQEYWRTLASYHPERTLEMIGQFAGESSPASANEVYGRSDIMSASPEELGLSFLNMMDARSIPGTTLEVVSSPYNNGQKALTFMADYPNTLGAAVSLAGAAAVPLAKHTAAGVAPLTGREAIQNNTGQAAQDCRDSDPTIVGAIIALANEQRKIALFERPGLYIGDVDHRGILLPDESESIPREWFTFSRGREMTVNGISIPLWQRLRLAVPDGEGFLLDELVDADTGDKLLYGAVVARKITVNLYAQGSPLDTTNTPIRLVDPTFDQACSQKSWCREINDLYSAFEEQNQTIGLRSNRVRRS